ncbi:MAG: hypothetical protein RBU24_10605 [Kiritimatiellia bacterium]|jgi:hypothetical protein|nr:hypothetical protein [Kiritimatiellia bacterium]MDX9793948.1 hypothetical protein [Kiritimatiellia bacterium]
MSQILELRRSQLVSYFQSAKCGNGECYCKTDCSQNGAIYGPRDPEFGGRYGDKLQVAVLSLDPGELYGPQTVQRTMPLPSIKLHKNKHWYRTLEIVHSIVKDHPNDPTIKKDVLDAIHFFCHLNSARCSQNKVGNEKANNLLFEKCRPFVIEELKILKPDILITQGDEAEIIASNFTAIHSEVLLGTPRTNLVVRAIGGKHVRHVHFYHPRHFGGFNRQRRALIVDNKIWEAVRKPIALQDGTLILRVLGSGSCDLDT